MNVVKFSRSLLFIIIIFIIFALIYFKPLINDYCTATGSFIRQVSFEKSQNFRFPINSFELLLKHLKFMLYSKKVDSKASSFTDNIGKFKISFGKYNQLDIVFEELFLRKEYYFKTDNETPFIIDCGSNIGISILFFKTIYPNSKIIGFEPSLTSFKFLQDNIQNNNISDVSVYRMALSNKKQELRLFNPGSIKSTVLNIENDSSNYEVVMATLLSEYINQKVDLLKLDVEGAETKIIKDLVNNNKLILIDKIIMEYHYPVKRNKLSKLLKILEDNKFSYQIKSRFKTPFSSNVEDDNYLIYAYKK